jgi:hypothetical protein
LSLGGFKRNCQCPEIAEESRGAGAVGGGEQYGGDIGPDQRPALLDEFQQPTQGCGLIQADDDGQAGLTACPNCSPPATGSLFDLVLGLRGRRRLPLHI